MGPFMDRRVKERLIGATILLVLIVLVVPELLSGPKGRGGSPSVAPPAAGAGEPMRNVTVDLATSKSPAAADPTAAAPDPGSAAATAAAAAPGPAAPGGAASDPAAAGGAGTFAAPSTAPAAPAPASVAPAAAAEGSSAALPAAAAPTISTLKAQQPVPTPDEPAASTAAANPGAPLRHGWTVQVGSFASRANADKLLRRMQALNSSAHISSGGTGAGVRYRVRIGPLADRNAAERTLAKLRKDGVSASLVAP